MTEGKSHTAEDIIDQMLTDLATFVSADTDRPGAICTNWILVAEWSTADGQAWCSRWTYDDRPMWQHQGLLHHALHGNWGRE
jgi:hypothetical protein